MIALVLSASVASAACTAPDVAALVAAADASRFEANFGDALITVTSAMARLSCVDYLLPREDLARLYQAGVDSAVKLARSELADAWCRRAAEMRLVSAFQTGTASLTSSHCAEAVAAVEREGTVSWTARYDGSVDGERVEAGQVLELPRGVHVVQMMDDVLRTREVSVLDITKAPPVRRPMPAARWVVAGGGVLLAAGGAAALTLSTEDFLALGRTEGGSLAGLAPRDDPAYDAAVDEANRLRLVGILGVAAGGGLMFGAGVWPTVGVTLAW